MIIRPATAADAARIVALWNPVIRDTTITFSSEEKTVDGIKADIAAYGGAFMVAEDAGTILGFARYGQFRGGPGYRYSQEHTIILAPEGRGQGVGRALMSAIEDHGRQNGVHVMVAGVSGENAAGIAFHKAVGYVVTGEMPEVGYKFGRWLDLVLLQKIL
ncbi:GNAT family N-acetyltransferase [Mesobacterium sp. TK19101]|uniref:GNAT family N-acetyltransferase n=1 Tax=Mesobacterium hydrothermale TaxID=3111907 RepID=A0ABU6HMV5_9RHOB|nr:GNAT family N-acetyltransferase [Mesobacterium sp. TK19101]MEC3863259.1 GNAT family N-acetyltransferase [Mesobacterium sp. TK19101]